MNKKRRNELAHSQPNNNPHYPDDNGSDGERGKGMQKKRWGKRKPAAGSLRLREKDGRRAETRVSGIEFARDPRSDNIALCKRYYKAQFVVLALSTTGERRCLSHGGARRAQLGPVGAYWGLLKPIRGLFSDARSTAGRNRESPQLERLTW